eukprot:gene26390-31888_t
MTEYQLLLSKRSRFLSILDDEIRIAEEILPSKHAAATIIQRAFRGLLLERFSACSVQPWVGRERMLMMNESSETVTSPSSIIYAYSSSEVFVKNEEVLEKMRQYNSEQAEHLEDEARERRKQMFESLAQNLHHLTSTRQIRGVYNPSLQYVQMPTMNALPVEEHIRGVVKDLLRTRGIAKRGLVPDTNNTLRIPLKVLKSRLSIQASSHYDAVKEAERKQKVTHKYVSMSSRNFLGGGKTTIIDNKDIPLAVGEPYMDAWANPMLVKGVPT